MEVSRPDGNGFVSAPRQPVVIQNFSRHGFFTVVKAAAVPGPVSCRPNAIQTAIKPDSLQGSAWIDTVNVTVVCSSIHTLPIVEQPPRVKPLVFWTASRNARNNSDPSCPVGRIEGGLYRNILSGYGSLAQACREPGCPGEGGCAGPLAHCPRWHRRPPTTNDARAGRGS